MAWLAAFRNTDTQSLCLAGKEIRYRDLNCSEWKKVTDATNAAKDLLCILARPGRERKEIVCAFAIYQQQQQQRYKRAGQGR